MTVAQPNFGRVPASDEIWNRRNGWPNVPGTPRIKPFHFGESLTVYKHVPYPSSLLVLRIVLTILVADTDLLRFTVH